MKRFILAATAVVSVAACNGPAEEAGKKRDEAAAAASGQSYNGEGPNQKLGEAQDRTNKSATDARDAQANELKQQGKAIREEADGRADKLEAEAKQIRSEADKRADVYDDRAKAVRQ
jgi:hypothetical protein